VQHSDKLKEDQIDRACSKHKRSYTFIGKTERLPHFNDLQVTLNLILKTTYKTRFETIFG
jgi:hypothetical protein